MEVIISRAKGRKERRYKGKDPLPWTYKPSHRYGVPGYPLVLDETGKLVDPIIWEIQRLPRGIATEFVVVDKFIPQIIAKGSDVANKSNEMKSLVINILRWS
jgi:hypothetical protein